jgi:hypothetical protein
LGHWKREREKGKEEIERFVCVRERKREIERIRGREKERKRKREKEKKREREKERKREREKNIVLLDNF